MNDDLNLPLPAAEPLDPALLRKISAQLGESQTPVRPLPSNLVLWLIGIALFLLLSFVIALFAGFKAIPVLSSADIGLYYGSIAVYAALFSRAIIERMIPGEPRRMHSTALWLGTVTLLGILLFFLFADHDTDQFVSQGIPCLRLGVIGALISGLIGWRFLRRGYLVAPRETLLLYGFFAGLVGIAVLALHCPIRNFSHFVVWHLGAMLLTGFAGLLLGRFFEHSNHAD